MWDKRIVDEKKTKINEFNNFSLRRVTRVKLEMFSLDSRPIQILCILYKYIYIKRWRLFIFKLWNVPEIYSR
jgi:hypothetical protein